MDLGALQEKANREITLFEDHVGNKDYDEILFLYMSKITEEIGNLAASVLGKEGLQAEQPLSNSEVESTFADALYSIVILAQKMNVNLDKVMADKIRLLEEEGFQEEEGL